MRALIKKLFTWSVRRAGLPFLVRELVQRNKVTILVLHDMAPEVAQPAFAYLDRHYNIISLNDYLEARLENQPGRIPPKALIITFDDGHIQNHALLPILKKTRIPVTIFLCSGIIDTNRHYWFKFQHEDIRTQALKELPNQERLEVLEAAGFHQEKEFEVPLALDRQQIEEMKPYVNFQAHTVFHPCLPRCTEAEARWALNKGKEILEHDFELSINALAYPNGDYSDRDIRLAQAAGYKLGLTVDFGYNTLHTDPFRLKRLSVDDYDDVDTLALKASGIWAFLKTRNGKKQAHGWTDQVVEDTDEAEYQSELKTYHNS